MPNEIKPQYVPKTIPQKLGYLIEACGETLAAAGKTFRWGLHSVNPVLPPEQQEPNCAWLLRELVDLERAIAYAKPMLQAEVDASGWKGPPPHD